MISETVRYPWIEDRPMVMSALTDTKSELRAVDEKLGEIREEQIEQRADYKHVHDALEKNAAKLDRLLKGNGC